MWGRKSSEPIVQVIMCIKRLQLGACPGKNYAYSQTLEISNTMKYKFYRKACSNNSMYEISQEPMSPLSRLPNHHMPMLIYTLTDEPFLCYVFRREYVNAIYEGYLYLFVSTNVCDLIPCQIIRRAWKATSWGNLWAPFWGWGSLCASFLSLRLGKWSNLQENKVICHVSGYCKSYKPLFNGHAHLSFSTHMSEK